MVDDRTLNEIEVVELNGEQLDQTCDWPDCDVEAAWLMICKRCGASGLECEAHHVITMGIAMRSNVGHTVCCRAIGSMFELLLFVPLGAP